MNQEQEPNWSESAMEPEEQNWTLQQFCWVAGQPWYALQRHSDHGIERQFTGYRHEMEAIIQELGIQAEELEPITEAEYIERATEQI